MVMKYKGYTITHNPKPIPTTAHDYDYSHNDYDGAPDSGDNRCGTAEGIIGAMHEIDILEDEELIQ